MGRRWAALVLAVACRQQPAILSGVIDVKVTKEGFEPSHIRVAPNAPVTLRITRTVKETCADAVDVQGDPVRHMLPLGAPVEVRVTPPASGQLAFACPMKMVQGAIVVVGQ